METLVLRSPPSAFNAIWLSFVGTLSRLAMHPVANFVLAKAVRRCSSTQLRDACAEILEVAEKLVSE